MDDYRINLNSRRIRRHEAKRVKKFNRAVFVVNTLIGAFHAAVIVGSLALVWLALENPEYFKIIFKKMPIFSN